MKSKLVLPLIIFSLLNCKQSAQEELDFHLNEVKKLNKKIPGRNWSVLRYYNEAKGLGYDLSGETSNSKERLCFHYSNDSSKYFIEYYIANTIIDSVEHVVELRHLDTLYYFTKRIGELTEKTFVIGKYTYLFMRNELGEGQREYYLLHRDSLKNVRGNPSNHLPTMQN
jgi:hypothetical protein